jgi:signal transduction histidine kinase
VERIVGAADRIRPPHLNARLPVGKVKHELSRIAETMNRMLDRLEQGFLRERQFNGDASHELRGPLAKVIAEIDVILSTDRSVQEYQEALVRCRGYVESLKRIVESLFLLARLDQEGACLDMQSTDLETLLVEVINRLPQADAERVELEIGEGDDPTCVECDGRLISVLVRNVLENALRYSPAEERVKVRVRRAFGKAVLEVEDHGPGIPQDRRDQVFDRFFRLDESRSRDTGGAGLGLAIVRAIARAHATEVQVRDSPRGGTTIVCSLPLKSLQPQSSHLVPEHRTVNCQLSTVDGGDAVIDPGES